MQSIKNNHFCIAVVLLALSGFGLSAQAQRSEGGIGFNYGSNGNYDRAELLYETPSLELYRFSSWGQIELTGELGAAYWSAHGSHDPSHVWQFNAIPMFRWWMSEGFYVEAGVGATAFTGTRFADKQIGSAFQFGDHLGVGVLVTPSNRLGLRYSHFSNAGIKRPNPGLDVMQVTYTYQF